MSKNAVRKGFDSPVTAREEDHLGRWPVAGEIFRVATESPRDWSVRIGVYGEWGSGKTSVLSFVREMARREGHLLVWFNPWECSTRDSLWKSFVGAVYRELETITGQTQRSLKVKAKAAAATASRKFAGTIKAGISIVNDTAGKAAEVGLDILKRHLVFSAEDLQGMREVLGEKRLIILIDDLDRTNPDLVPEILFALKEIMDIPGIAFICAFDPKVVGEVLGKYHPGYGDGLRFLDKIIDYPRWLSRPAASGMAALAQAERNLYCPFVPLPELLDAVAALPRNPRVLRQFIRLLALLRPQVERHYDTELSWPVILAANVLKVYHPQLAQATLGDEAFIDGISRAWIQQQVDDEKKETLASMIGGRLEQQLSSHELHLGEVERNKITELLARVFDVATPWATDAQAVQYQVQFVESPHTVTWKEFDTLLDQFREKQKPDTVQRWIVERTAQADCREEEVYRELIQASVHRRTNAMNKIADVKLEADMQGALDDASDAMSLLEHLLFSLGQLERVEKWLSGREVSAVLGGMFMFIEWENFKRLRDQRHRAKELLRKLFKAWTGNVDLLVSVLKEGRDRPDPLVDKVERAIRLELHGIVMPRFAEQTLARFKEEGFVERVFREDAEDRSARELLLAETGELWRGLRRPALEQLSSASREPVVQRNAVELLYRFDHMLKQQPGHHETSLVEKLLKNKKIAKALWAAAVSSRLNPRMIGQLRELPAKLEGFGVKVRTPRWWTEVLEKAFPK